MVGPDRSQFPFIDRTAPRVVRVSTSTTTTPATTSTKSLSTIRMNRMRTELEYLPRDRRQNRLIAVEGWGQGWLQIQRVGPDRSQFPLRCTWSPCVGRRGGAVVGFVHARRPVFPDAVRRKQTAREGEAASRGSELVARVSIVVPVRDCIGRKRKASLGQWD